MNNEQEEPQDWRSADYPGGRSRRGRGRGVGGWRGFGPDGPVPGWVDGPFPGGPGGPGRGFRRSGRVRRGDVRLAILALLAEEPLNGYQMIQAVSDRTNGEWRPSPGAVYPALSQLEDERLVEAFQHEGQKVFRLTEAGIKAAAEVDPKPWDLVNDAAPDDAGDVAGLWREFGSLATAAKAVMASGSPRQIQTATSAIADTRKRLFGILAADAPETGA